MPKAPHISYALAKAKADAFVAAVDAALTAGRLRIYDGTKPVGGPDEAIVAQVLLAEVTLQDPAFPAASDANPGAITSANGLPISDTSADASGTATWFRQVDGDGVAILDGTCGTTDADCILDDVNLVAGQEFKIVQYDYKILESGS